MSKGEKEAREEEAKKQAAKEEADRIKELAAQGAFKNPVCGHTRPTQDPEGELLTNVTVYRFQCGCLHLVGDGELCVTSDGWWAPVRKGKK
jgi:hypothetical protein